MLQLTGWWCAVCQCLSINNIESLVSVLVLIFWASRAKGAAVFTPEKQLKRWRKRFTSAGPFPSSSFLILLILERPMCLIPTRTVIITLSILNGRKRTSDINLRKCAGIFIIIWVVVGLRNNSRRGQVSLAAVPGSLHPPNAESVAQTFVG